MSQSQNLEVTSYEKTQKGERALLTDILRLTRRHLGENHVNDTITDVLSYPGLFQAHLAAYHTLRSTNQITLPEASNDTPCGQTETDAIANLTNKINLRYLAIQMLTPEQHRLFTDAQITSLTPEKIRGMGKHLTAEEIEAIGPENISISEAESDFTVSKMREIRGTVSGHPMPIEHIRAIGGVNLAKKGMTIAKMYRASGLTIEQIQAIRGENLALDSMTDTKICAIRCLQPEQITAIGGRNLAMKNMTVENIQASASLLVEQIEAVGPDHLQTPDMTPSKIKAIAELSIKQIQRHFPAILKAKNGKEIQVIIRNEGRPAVEAYF